MSVVEQFVKAAGGQVAKGGPGSGRHKEGDSVKVEHPSLGAYKWESGKPNWSHPATVVSTNKDSYRVKITDGPQRGAERIVGENNVHKKSPPGWADTVEAMKDHPEIDNPWALAWSMHNEGDTPHYKGLVEKFCDITKCY